MSERWSPDEEDEALRWSWERHAAEHLDGYLVADVEDPRIHAQSILTRALVADTLWPGEFTDLIDAEQRFGVVMTWILGRFKAGVAPADLYDAVVERECPGYVAETHYWLPQQDVVRDYITLALQNHEAQLPELALETFAELWRGALAGREVGDGGRLRVLEAACGSANDYRYLHAFGFAPFLDYAGFDISPKNIDNARRRFAGESGAEFFVASAFDTGLPDGAYDFVFVHDLFEHLSAAGLERALGEVLRVAGRQAWLHFFNLSLELGEHDIRPVDAYHWNLLSLARVRESLAGVSSEVEVVAIAELLERQFGCGDYYNREAVTLLVTK